MSNTLQKPSLTVCESHCRKIKAWSSKKQRIKLNYSHDSWTGICFAHCVDCSHCTAQFLIQITSQKAKLNYSFNNYCGLLAAHKMIRRHYVLKNEYLFTKVFVSLCWLLNDTKYSRDDGPERQIFWTSSQILFRLICTMRPKQMQWIMNSKLLSQRVFDLCNLLDIMLDEYTSFQDARSLIGISILYLITKMQKYEEERKILLDIKCNKNIKKQYKEWMTLKVQHFDLTSASKVNVRLGNIKDKQAKQSIHRYKAIYNSLDEWVIECGNSKCEKDYLLNKYGLIHQQTMKNPHLWKNKKVINKWYLCSRCKFASYCSRKCQKIAWNKENHKRQCIKNFQFVVEGFMIQ